MAYLKAYRTGLGGTPKAIETIHVIGTEEAKKEASRLMSMEVPPFTTLCGTVAIHPYSRVDVYSDNGKYITTAWGE